MKPDYDVLILGGGLVGASLALALQANGQRVAVLESMPQSGQLDRQDQTWDARIYAISPSNQRFLAGLGAWPDARIAAIRAMDVRGDAGGQLYFSAQDAGVPVLAWITENRWLLAALWQQLETRQIERFSPAVVTHLALEPQAAHITLQDGRAVSARLLVGADGANSWLRAQLAIDATPVPYGQSGVVANFSCENEHGGIARQWFSGHSVLAWLPLPGRRISMVWSTADAPALLALSADELCTQVALAGRHTLGALQLLTPAQAFPLQLMRPARVMGTRVVLVGDAAHTVHPLAGQGVNLGFGDAQVLRTILAQATDPGAHLLLRRYERERIAAVRTMQYTCDGLFRLFHTTQPLLGVLRNHGLSCLNHLTPAKRILIRHAMGV